MLAEKARPYLGRPDLGYWMADDPKQLCCAVHDGMSAHCGFPNCAVLLTSPGRLEAVGAWRQFLLTQVSKYRIDRHPLLQFDVLRGFKVALENNLPCMTIGNPVGTKRYYQQVYV